MLRDFVSPLSLPIKLRFFFVSGVALTIDSLLIESLDSLIERQTITSNNLKYRVN